MVSKKPSISNHLVYSAKVSNSFQSCKHWKELERKGRKDTARKKSILKAPMHKPNRQQGRAKEAARSCGKKQMKKSTNTAFSCRCRQENAVFAW